MLKFKASGFQWERAKNMNKRIPKFKTDKELEKFLDQDLSEYINKENLIPASFEFEAKNKVIMICSPISGEIV